MTVNEFYNELKSYKYSKEYFSLYKEACELDIFDLYTEEKNEDGNEKKGNFITRIWNTLKNGIIRFVKWIIKKIKMIKRKVISKTEYTKEEVDKILETMIEGIPNKLFLLDYMKKPSKKLPKFKFNDYLKKEYDESEEKYKNMFYSILTKRYVYDVEKYNKDKNVNVVTLDTIKHYASLENKGNLLENIKFGFSYMKGVLYSEFIVDLNVSEDMLKELEEFLDKFSELNPFETGELKSVVAKNEKYADAAKSVSEMMKNISDSMIFYSYVFNDIDRINKYLVNYVFKPKN